jgi:pectin methylesterase-like acyl-CoA thioesterase
MRISRRKRQWGLSLALAASVGLSASLAKGANYLVDPNWAGTNGAAGEGYTGVYNSINAALGTGGVPSGASSANVNRIYVSAGTYNTGNVTGTSLVNSANNIALIGLTGNAGDVVITSTLDAGYNTGTGLLGTANSATLQLKGNNVSAANITFANSTDTPAIVNGTFGFRAVTPQGNYTTANFQLSNSPAVALYVQGDETAFQNCKFEGYQDTLWAAGGRSYFTNCYVTGDVDFIFGSGTAVFSNTQVNLDGDHSGGTIVAPSTDKRTSNGFVFLNDTVTGNSVKNDPVIDPFGSAKATGPNANSMNLGRGWGWTQPGGDAGAVFVNTEMTSAILNTGWLLWNSNETNAGNNKNGGNPAEDVRFAEYNSMDLSANALNVSSRVTWSHQLTATQAAAYTVANVFAREAQYPWYGNGYPSSDLSNPGTGSANPSNANYSWPAFWGDRNSNNDTNNASVSAAYPTPGNPSAYSDPAWTIGGSWDPNAQLSAALSVPEPASLASLCMATTLLFRGRRCRCDDS